jgi:GntR family transcriptional regulator
MFLYDERGPTLTTVAAPVIRTNGVPFYIQVADHLREELRDGRWQVGDLIPSEAALCELYGVSRTAIRQALGQLVLEGMLYKERGRGTFVSRPQVSLAVQETRGFFDEMTERGLAVQTTILRQGEGDLPVAFAADLHQATTGRAVVIERTRAVGSETLVYVTTYLPLPRFDGLAHRNLSNVSLYAVLAQDYGAHITNGRRRIEATKATDAVARYLDIRKGMPILRVTAVNYDDTGVPFEVFEAYYRADRTSFEVIVSAADHH